MYMPQDPTRLPRMNDAAPALLARFRAVRGRTEALAAPLSAEDQCVQSMPDASPAKWHRAHTTWFFENFVLGPHWPGYRVFHSRFGYLFNSYYVAAGPRHARPRRGMLTRPSAGEVGDYRAHVDVAMERLLSDPPAELENLVELGLQHEEQHQELLLTDILHALAENPMRPVYDHAWREPVAASGLLRWLEGATGPLQLGHVGRGFAFDNETPRHTAWLAPHRLADRLVTNAEWQEFMTDGGYANPVLWMSDGWAQCQAEGWQAPMYWDQGADGWEQFTLAGPRAPDPEAPVRHISWYEADAFARWAGRRLPTEAELDAGLAMPSLQQGMNVAWQWTGSAYRPYPGFQPLPGAVGEYNGKFMINVMVLRGGSQASSPGHARPGYRNFFGPEKRWQFSGLRLAEDV